MSYEIDKRIINYTGRRTTANKYVIAHESGNPNNVGPNSLEGEVKYMQGQAAAGRAFTSHWVGSGGRIVQIAPTGYIQYGAGGIANPYSYAQVELARTNNADTFKKDYAAYVWLLRTLAAECGIPQTLDKTGYGIKTHLWVTNNLGNTDHTDPYAYLNSWGISAAQFAADIANGMDVVEPITANGSLVYVDYNATIMHGGYSVDSKPWGDPGAETWSNTTDWMYKTVHFREESADRAYANGDYFGWVDKRALGKARKNARYTATVISGGFSVDSLPWGEDGYYQLGLTDNHVYSVVTVLMESASGEYAYIRNSEKELGWVDKKALAEGIIPKPEAAPTPTVVPAVLHLPGGEEWVTYPSEGPYQAGDVISLEDAAAYTVLGERNGSKVLIVELENFGVVGIRFDKDKGATIEN